jgi:hypothetical protein
MYGIRGLADVTDTTGAPCPGSPGCPGYVAPGSMEYQTSLLQELLALQSAPAPVGTPGGGPPSSFAERLNANAGKIAIGAGVFLALVLFARAGR